MRAITSYLGFIRENAPFLAVGVLLSFLSSFGQTFVIAVFAGEIRAEFGLSHGDWGVIYMIGTGASAAVMVFAGGLTDRFRVRSLGIATVGLLALACLAMAFNTYASALVVVIFALRFFGQGMASHISVVAISRWFIKTRGRALAISALGFMLAEAAMPLTFAWLKSFVHWRHIWIGCAVFAVLMMPVLWRLLRLERTPQSVTKSESALGMDSKHWTRMEALRHPLFWALVPAMSLFPAFATAFWFHQVHFAAIKGWDHISLVAVFPLGTFTFMASTFLFGWAIDRFGAGRLLPLYLLPLAAAFVVHWYAPTVAWAALGVILMGFAGGGQATLPAAVWSGYYGTAHIGSIKSAATALMVLGSAIGPGLSGWLIDVGFGFEQQLLFYATSFVIGAAGMVLPLRTASKRLPVAA